MSLPGRQSALRNKVKNLQCLTWFLRDCPCFLSNGSIKEEMTGSDMRKWGVDCAMNGSKLSKRVATECDHWLMISALRKVGGQQEKGGGCHSPQRVALVHAQRQ